MNHLSSLSFYFISQQVIFKFFKLDSPLQCQMKTTILQV